MIRAVLLLLLAASCAPLAGARADGAEAKPDLMTALFLDARSIEPRLATGFACAGIENAGTEEDPPAQVLGSLRGRLGTPVYPQSVCRRDERTSEVVAESRHRGGTWLTIGDIACPEASRCSATVSYYVANQGSGGREVRATRSAAGWRIVPSGRMWIS